MSTHESNGTTDSMEQPSLALPKRFARCIERLTDGASEEEISEIREELQLVERLNTRDRRTEDDEQRISRHIWQNRSDDIADGDSECAESNQKADHFRLLSLKIQDTVHN